MLVTEFFGKAPVAGVDPEEVVALEAALQADELERRSGRALMLDVTALPLGVGMLGGKVRHLIARNTALSR
ncbi:MAG: Hsp70 family protein [Myxococcaceae bacterium]